MSYAVPPSWRKLALTGLLSACAHNQPAPRTPAPEQPPTRRAAPTQPDAVRLYRQMGLLAEGGDTPFVGSVAFLASKSSDSTMFLLTVSVPTRALTFVRENDRYRASYSATLAGLRL